MMQKLKNYDYTLMIVPILLALFGIVMIYSASMVTAVVEGLESNHYLIRQTQWFLLGLTAMITLSLFPYQYYQRLVKIIIVSVILMLIGVKLFGTTAGNAQSWFRIGSVGIQPAEFAKIGIIIYLASVYSKKQKYIDDFYKAVLPPLVMTGIILTLIVVQPDIGTSFIILLIAGSVIISSGIRFKHLLILVMCALTLILIAIPNMVTDVRVNRVTGAYQPFEAPETAGHHLIQSYLAIGVGGLTGEGLGQSVQKLGFLFGAHTDFIMSVIAEELGFLGVVIVLGLLATIVLRGLYISSRCKDSFGALLAIGISSMIGIQAFINLGSISGILPITGVTLPFVSYGGSSLLVLMASVGILNNIAKQVKSDESDSDEPNKKQSKPSHLNQRMNKQKAVR
ncbi:putative lipid II flippase FtsW [Lentibacillus sp. JNUCC-1]|uniref:FtsW/RodA/SpoVE family cell cycle protein n=1 Tax=Lentibacillus sp. JNUCC-1 TaxID=2654513 RepID=UPI0012E7E742|nr:FtsW/RodA/SpoVE family cell cycle protein [Lentibacillus sp. JNUCC-1]MUV36255.1 putative lipid II flippase FtsW [Lentibacillus sp. JNUCC-1]